MGRRSAALQGIGSFFDGLVKGQQIGLKLAEARRDEDVRNQIGAVDQDFTPRETPAASGEDALAAGLAAKQDALKTSLSEEEIAATDARFKPTLDALEAQRSTPAGIIRSMGIGPAYRQQAEPFSENDVQGAKSAARADVYRRAGRGEEAARELLNEGRRRELSDQDEIRNAMKPRSPAALLASGATDMADVTASHTQPTSASGPTQPENPRVAVMRDQGAIGPIHADQDRQATDAYFQRKAPAVVDAYLKQGRLDEAKRYRDFIDSEAGRNYARTWSRGVRLFAIGDHAGALKTWQAMYNDQTFNDGRTVKMEPAENGQMRVTQFDADGKETGTRTMPIDALARQAGIALSPEKYAEFQAQQEGKRASEAASLDKGIELETLRQQGRDRQEDRRDERLQQRLDAQSRNLERRLGTGSKVLTATQERANAEIDAARELVTGMDPAEIQRRSAKATNTGRENPDYSPAIAKAAALAARRKVGDDPVFDNRDRQPTRKQAPIDAAKAAMAADPAMKGYTLGDQTMKGFKVFDSTGKHVGFYGRQ